MIPNLNALLFRGGGGSGLESRGCEATHIGYNHGHRGPCIHAKVCSRVLAGVLSRTDLRSMGTCTRCGDVVGREMATALGVSRQSAGRRRQKLDVSARQRQHDSCRAVVSVATCSSGVIVALARGRGTLLDATSTTSPPRRLGKRARHASGIQPAPQRSAARAKRRPSLRVRSRFHRRREHPRTTPERLVRTWGRTASRCAFGAASTPTYRNEGPNPP